MLEYNPTSKLYLVKRVHVPSHILEEAASREKDKEEKGACEVQSTLCVLTYIQPFPTPPMSISNDPIFWGLIIGNGLVEDDTLY